MTVTPSNPGAQDAGTVAVNYEQTLSGPRVSVDETADETHRLVREHSMQVKREIIEVGRPRTLTFYDTPHADTGVRGNRDCF